MNVDIVFLTLPRLETRSPITAPALLKSMVEAHGFKAKCIDLNIDLWHAVNPQQHGDKWFDTDLTFRKKEEFLPFFEQYIEPEVDRWLIKIMEHNPTWIGITLFSQRTALIGQKMCEILRDNTDAKIVVGGPYTETLGPTLYKKDLVDAYVIGEGEHAIINVLNNNLDAPGINGNRPEQIDNLDDLPLPDYSDFNMDQYSQKWHEPTRTDRLGCSSIYITGSRGCVRRCSFCDIGHMWPKYRYRSGKSLAEEMKEQSIKYGIYKFMFTDSLINGSVKQLNDLCDTLIEYYKTGQMQPVQWQGQFIARPERQMGEDVFKKMAKAGCNFISVGIESGSEKVRDHMKKMFSDEDLDFNIRMCLKYNIEMQWLMLVGYPTEDEIEFQKTLDFITKYKYAQSVVKGVTLGPTLDIVPGSPIYEMKDEMGIHWQDVSSWKYNGNDRKTRIIRWLRMKKHCIDEGYNITEKATKHLLNELKTMDAEKEIQMYDLGSMGPTS